MLIGLLVSHDQNNKDGQQVRKTLTFQTETNIMHHYKGILLLKLFFGRTRIINSFCVGVEINSYVEPSQAFATGLTSTHQRVTWRGL